ncbi:MAG: hypothetical protein F4X11_26680 [Acidobacteria bacterium]|nr:hypothetical protein [Acidobacteriota bacterium]
MSQHPSGWSGPLRPRRRGGKEAWCRRFPAYPEYKDSGVDWLPEVPAHWEMKPISAASRGRKKVFAPRPCGPEHSPVRTSGSN